MVRYYRRRPFFRARRRRRAKTSRRTYTRKAGVMGNRFRARYKAKKGKWQKFTFFGNIQPAMNIDNDNAGDAIIGESVPIRPPVSAAVAAAGYLAGTMTMFHQPSRTALFGQAWTPPLPPANVLNADGNPTNLGDGLLSHIAARDPMMGVNRWDYGGFDITEQLIGDNWNRMNNGPGGVVQIPTEQIYIKGVKVSITSRTTNRPGMVFIGKRPLNKPMKIIETLGKGTAYIGTKKNQPGVWTPLAAGRVQWHFPATVSVCAPIYNRIQIDVFYKIKLTTNN